MEVQWKYELKENGNIQVKYKHLNILLKSSS